jgi:hypothetical protein
LPRHSDDSKKVSFYPNLTDKGDVVYPLSGLLTENSMLLSDSLDSLSSTLPLLEDSLASLLTYHVKIIQYNKCIVFTIIEEKWLVEEMERSKKIN